MCTRCTHVLVWDAYTYGTYLTQPYQKKVRHIVYTLHLSHIS
jgi:hypothetical protein